MSNSLMILGLVCIVQSIMLMILYRQCKDLMRDNKALQTPKKFIRREQTFFGDVFYVYEDQNGNVTTEQII